MEKPIKPPKIECDLTEWNQSVLDQIVSSLGIPPVIDSQWPGWWDRIVRISPERQREILGTDS